jgi:gamma-glutamyltranspeptidase/glutathione hydrolase
MREPARSSLEPHGGRPPAMGRQWMVSAPNALAAQAGASILADGGTAADAAVAVAAALSVVYPHMTGIGGDLFALYYDAQAGDVTAFNGSGAAAALANPEFYTSQGCDAIPERGGVAALTVPGAVDAWFALQQRFGSMEMTRLLMPAIEFARDGVPIARSLARSMDEERAFLDTDEGARTAYGSGRPAGAVLTQPALARTIGNIAARGRAWFYEGEGAARIDAYCARIGSPLRAGDFAAHRGAWTAPIRTSFRAAESLSTPPNSQGVALLLAQAIYEEFTGSSRLADCSAEFVHATVEAARLAYADRDRYVCDPDYTPAPLELVLSRGHARASAARIDPNAAGVNGRPAGLGDRGSTTYFACVDSHGNAASVIQSIYQHFGAAVVVPELGIALHNRGCWFTLDEGRPRSLAPGRRPFHTLIANMLLRNGKPWVIYGSMGGDAQPQFGLALSIRIAERGVNPQDAIDAPRWRLSSDTPGADPEIFIESRVRAGCIAGLRARGHRVTVCPEWEESMGHAGAIVIDRENGVMLGGSDPRSDGLALGM